MIPGFNFWRRWQWPLSANCRRIRGLPGNGWNEADKPHGTRTTDDLRGGYRETKAHGTQDADECRKPRITSVAEGSIKRFS